LRPPVAAAGGGLALLSIADRDKPLLRDVAGALARAGYRYCATRGTALALQAAGYEVEELGRVDERPDNQRSVLDAILSGEVTLVVNTPSPESRPMRDAGAIRRAALAEGILCLTSIDTALAAAQALDPDIANDLGDVRPLDEWLSLEMGLTAL
jgi:carbamoyl-phosphate synthase large subunit